MNEPYQGSVTISAADYLEFIEFRRDVLENRISVTYGSDRAYFPRTHEAAQIVESLQNENQRYRRDYYVVEQNAKQFKEERDALKERIDNLPKSVFKMANDPEPKRWYQFWK